MYYMLLCATFQAAPLISFFLFCYCFYVADCFFCSLHARTQHRYRQDLPFVRNGTAAEMKSPVRERNLAVRSAVFHRGGVPSASFSAVPLFGRGWGTPSTSVFQNAGGFTGGVGEETRACRTRNRLIRFVFRRAGASAASR